MTHNKHRVRRSGLLEKAENLTRVQFEEAVLRGMRDLEHFWQRSDADQRRIVLENNNLIDVLRSVALQMNENHEEAIEKGSSDHIAIDQDLHKRAYSLKDIHELLVWFKGHISDQQFQNILVDPEISHAISSSILKDVRSIFPNQLLSQLDFQSALKDQKIYNLSAYLSTAGGEQLTKCCR